MSNYFSGSLRGYTVGDLHSMVDHSENCLDGRLSISEEIVNTGFFEEYFDNHYDVHYNKNTPLSEEHNVCRLLDRLGTYILMSDEEVEERKTSDSPHHTMDYLISKMNRESSLESIATDGEWASTIIHNIKSSDVSKIAANKTIQIRPLTKEKIDDMVKYVGIDDEETLMLIDSYADYYMSLNKSSAPKRKIDRIKMGIRKDIEGLIEDSLPPVQHNNMEFNNSNSYEVSVEDLTKQHSLVGVTFYNTQGSLEYQPGLLFYNKGDGLDVEDSLQLMLHDLDNIVNRSGLTEREKKVLTLLRKGVNMSVVAERVGISPRTATRDKQRIVEKVLKTSKGLNKEG